jgi:hypothetical protein
MYDKTYKLRTTTFEDATQKKKWKEAMMEEYQSIMKKNVSEIMTRP